MRAFFLSVSTVMLVCPAQSDAEVVWVDANGRTIAPLAGDVPPMDGPASALAYVAPDGLIWSMNAETATVSPRQRATSETGIFFADPECTGPAYVAAAPPRYVFRIPDTSCAWARPDDLTSEMFSVTYYSVGSSCVRSVARYLMLMSRLIVVDPTPPDLGACPPLHIERRDPK